MIDPSGSLPMFAPAGLAPGASPRVSVICIFYNAELYLGEALDSVLAQDFQDFELLLVDDGSTDGGTTLAQDYVCHHPGKVRYFDHPGHANRGMSATRNRGIDAARGDCIAFIDADDVWQPDKLAAQLAILDADPQLGVVCGALDYWHSWNGGRDRIVRLGRRQDVRCTPPETVLDLYPLGTFPAASVDALIRREVFARVGRFEEQFTGLYEDQAFFAKVYATTPIYFSSQAWLRYRQHPGSCVAQAHGSGAYLDRRRAFLNWFSGWVQNRDLAGKARIERALRRELWKLDHPLTARILNRLQRLLPNLLR